MNHLSFVLSAAGRLSVSYWSPPLETSAHLISPYCALVIHVFIMCINIPLVPPCSQCVASPRLSSLDSTDCNSHPVLLSCPCAVALVSLSAPRPAFLSSRHSLLASMAGLQRATAYSRGARCCGDLDRQGSDTHQREAAGNAARFRQVPAAEHQAPRRRCAPLLVGSCIILILFMSSSFPLTGYLILDKRITSSLGCISSFELPKAEGNWVFGDN